MNDESKLREDIQIGLSVGKDNPTYRSLIEIIKNSLELETLRAIGRDVSGEARAWQCGRADVLRDLLDAIEDNRAQALRQRGLPLDQ